MAIVLDPDRSVSTYAMVNGGTVSFVAPELLAHEIFGWESLILVREADVFTFGLVPPQVSPLNHS